MSSRHHCTEEEGRPIQHLGGQHSVSHGVSWHLKVLKIGVHGQLDAFSSQVEGEQKTRKVTRNGDTKILLVTMT